MTDADVAIEDLSTDELVAKNESIEASRRETQSRADSEAARANKAETTLRELQAANANAERARFLEMSDEDAGKAMKIELGRQPTEAEVQGKVEENLTVTLLQSVRNDPDFAALSKADWEAFVETLTSADSIPLKVAEYKVKLATANVELNQDTDKRVNAAEERNDVKEVPVSQGGAGSPTAKLTFKRMKSMTAEEINAYPIDDRMAALANPQS